MSEPAPLPRTSLADTLAAALRDEILEGALPAGTPLREVELAGRYDVSRHTLRAALRRLESEGLVRVEPHRGARVAGLEREELLGLWELRTALEVEAARLALERHGGRLPAGVHRAVARLGAACARPEPSWRTLADLHAAVHGALVEASESPRIRAAYATLAGELRLFLLELRPVWSPARMASHHEELVEGLEREGADVLRRHLREGVEAVLGAAPAPPS